MTPRRLDPNSLNEKLDHMRRLLARLERLGPMTRERLEDDDVERAAGNHLVHGYLGIDLDQLAAAFALAQEEYGEHVRQAASCVEQAVAAGDGR